MGAYSNQALQSQELGDLRKQIEGSQVRVRTKQRRRQKAPHRPHSEECSDLVQGSREGRTVYELATQFGVHRQTVSEVLKREGVPRRRRPLSSAESDKAFALRGEGWTFARIGAELRCDPSTVCRTLAKIGSVAHRK